MTKKYSYEELESRIEYLESELAKYRQKGKGETAGVDFKRLVDQSRDAIYHYDMNCRSFLYCNKRFFGLFAAETENGKAVTTQSVLLHIHPDDREKVKAARDQSLGPNEHGGEIEYRFLGSDGSIRWLHDRWTVMRDGNGSVMAIEGFIRDNTDRKQAEEELEQSRRNALIGSYIAQDGKFLYVNSEFTRITTYTESELLGTHPLEIVHPDYKEHVRDSAVKMLKGECSVPYEFCIVTRHGEIKWIMETVTPIQYSRKPAALGYFMDVTSMKQAEKERQEKERLHGVLELVGAVGHELNNPMQTITVCSDALSDDMVDSEVLKKNLGLIKQSVARMANTYKKLMNITKYATKEYASGKKIIDINEASQ